MARMRSKRHRQEREEYMLKEELKIEEGIFDNRTMLRLGKLFTKGVISGLGFLISTGKEADVYMADAGEKVKESLVAVKVFRIETSSFFKRTDYMLGDPRFPKIKKNIYWIVNEWCKKEFGNLKISAAAGVHSPQPYSYNGNVLAMEFIGDSGGAAKRLRDIELKDPEAVLKTILSDVRKLFRSKLVHSDLSEYNVLMKGETPFLIDFGQAVVIKHPKAMEFLRRDVQNILNYFERRYEVKKDGDEVFEHITGVPDAQ